MKITKARLKQIIKEELEAVVNEEEEEQVEEAYAGARPGPSHRDRPAYQRATVGGRVAARSAGTPTLDAAADALGMSAVDLMKALADEMLEGGEDVSSEPPLDMPEGE